MFKTIKTIKLIMSYISDSILDTVGGSKDKEVIEEVAKDEEPAVEVVVSKENNDVKEVK